MPYTLCIILFMIGLYAVATKRNLIKIVIGFIIMENSANLLLIMLGYRAGGRAPVAFRDGAGDAATAFAQSAVDPLPQALVLTSIVISLGVTALMVAICLRVYQRYGTFDITEIRRLRG
jgi:multicomponent Na+:H+ antiporter subunit C